MEKSNKYNKILKMRFLVTCFTLLTMSFFFSCCSTPTTDYEYLEKMRNKLEEEHKAELQDYNSYRERNGEPVSGYVPRKYRHGLGPSIEIELPKGYGESKFDEPLSNLNNGNLYENLANYQFYREKNRREYFKSVAWKVLGIGLFVVIAVWFVRKKKR